jgi:hypothetical protein
VAILEAMCGSDVAIVQQEGAGREHRTVIAVRDDKDAQHDQQQGKCIHWRWKSSELDALDGESISILLEQPSIRESIEGNCKDENHILLSRRVENKRRSTPGGEGIFPSWGTDHEITYELVKILLE